MDKKLVPKGSQVHIKLLQTSLGACVWRPEQLLHTSKATGGAGGAWLCMFGAFSKLQTDTGYNTLEASISKYLT